MTQITRSDWTMYPAVLKPSPRSSKSSPLAAERLSREEQTPNAAEVEENVEEKVEKKAKEKAEEEDDGTDSIRAMEAALGQSVAHDLP